MALLLSVGFTNIFLSMRQPEKISLIPWDLEEFWKIYIWVSILPSLAPKSHPGSFKTKLLTLFSSCLQNRKARKLYFQSGVGNLIRNQ